MVYMPDVQDKKTAAGKEPVEIACVECDTKFRLWVPGEMLPEWKKGVRINCVRCGAQYLVKKVADGFDITQVATPAPPERVKVRHEEYEEARPAKGPDSSSESVLIVEDDRLSREMVAASLSELGFRTVPAKNAAEALKAAKAQVVSLIVTDLYLKNPADPASNMDGEELLQKMRSTGFEMPAIVTTGKDIIDDLVLDPKWFELKVKGFIQKGNPFWVEELKLKVKEVLYKG